LSQRFHGAGFVNHFFPDAFVVEDEFDEFAGGAAKKWDG
jgi:hypothetical protein